jgi:hypothetical protein
MRRLCALAGMTAMVAAAALGAEPAAACSVFSRHPCAPVVACSVFHHGPCIPDYGIPLPQDLRLTIESAAQPTPSATSGERADESEHKLNTIRAMFDALRACWVPPDKDDARPGMQMSVRFAFKRSGEMIAPPRVTYATPGVSSETRDTYLHAIDAALERCTPLHFTDGMAGAIAGKPIAIRFVDNRTFEGPTDDRH